jgi:hypothetical protein
MPFYAFRLNAINFINQRGKIPDDDLITFQVSINGAPRTTAGVRIESVVSGEQVVLAPPLDRSTVNTPIPPTTPAGARADWILGPCEIKAGDNVEIGFSGTNVSDWELGPDTKTVDDITLKLADKVFFAMAGLAIDGISGALVGAGVSGVADVASKLSDALRGISDPVGSLIGVKPQGPCNGISFAGAIRFSGEMLAAKPFHLPDQFLSLPDGVEWQTDSGVLTDESNHDTSVCGHIAQTQVFFSVIRIPEFSLHKDFHPSLTAGLRQYLPPHRTTSLARFLGLRA